MKEGRTAKVVYNARYGGFSLSREAVLRGREISGDPAWGGTAIKGDVYESGEVCDYDYGYIDLPRHDAVLVQVVEELGERANGKCADLRIHTVSGPYLIDEYDGNERVMEANDYVYINPWGE